MKKPFLSVYEIENYSKNDSLSVNGSTRLTETVEDTDYDCQIIVSGTMYTFTKEDTDPNNFIDAELHK